LRAEIFLRIVALLLLHPAKLSFKHAPLEQRRG
jgi:hypothetical protein